MWAGRYNFDGSDGWFAGEFLRKSLTAYQDENRTIALDLTGWSGAFRIVQGAPDTEPVVMSTANGGMVLGDAAGTIEIDQSSVSGSPVAMEAGTYRYVLELRDAANLLQFQLKGSIVFRGDFDGL